MQLYKLVVNQIGGLPLNRLYTVIDQFLNMGRDRRISQHFCRIRKSDGQILIERYPRIEGVDVHITIPRHGETIHVTVDVAAVRDFDKEGIHKSTNLHKNVLTGNNITTIYGLLNFLKSYTDDIYKIMFIALSVELYATIAVNEYNELVGYVENIILL